MKIRILSLFLLMMFFKIAVIHAEENKTFFPNGNVRTEETETMRKSYFDNGQVNMETPLLNGVEDGLGKIYYADGKLMNEIQYKKGEPIYVKQYYPTGKLMREDDKVKQTWKQYDEEGKLVAEGES